MGIAWAKQAGMASNAAGGGGGKRCAGENVCPSHDMSSWHHRGMTLAANISSMGVMARGVGAARAAAAGGRLGHSALLGREGAWQIIISMATYM